MTKEEAIKRLKNTAWLGTDKDREETEQAIDMAIEALRQPPNDDWERCADHLWKEAYERGKQETLQAEPKCKTCAIKELWQATEKEDLVEVVRCKNCKLQQGCKNAQYLGIDGYCSYGEM